MSVTHPITVVSYQVSLSKDSARIALYGIEGQAGDVTPAERQPSRIGYMEFLECDQEGGSNIINRGGFLTMRRPMTMLAAILDVLRNEKPLFLDANGTLSTSGEPASEEESD